MRTRIPRYVVGLSVLGTGAGVTVLLKGKSHDTYDGLEKIHGRTVIVTGANSGMGRELSQELALQGGRILMACRDLEKCEAARKEIMEATVNKNIECKKLDLASLKSIRTFAEDINKNESRLDILVNNAGVMRCPYTLTEDGFETHLGVNYLGHFLLTNLLLDKLKACRPSRIINTTSLAYTEARMNFKDLNSAVTYDGTQAYAQSKLAVLLFSTHLAKRLQGTDVSTYAVNPGIVKTNLGRHLAMNKSFLSSFILEPLWWFSMSTPHQGIQTALYCATAPETADISGKYWSNKQIVEPQEKGTDEQAAQRLWLISERWTRKSQ